MRAIGLRRFVLAAALAAGCAAFAAPSSAEAQIDFGVRAGAYLEDNDPFVGLELLTRLGSTEWFFNPNLEFVFADDRDRISGNFDFHYDFRTTGDYYLWGGAGAAIINRERPNGDDETEGGANLLAGIGWRLSDLTPYAQLKIVLADDSEVVAGVGLRF